MKDKLKHLRQIVSEMGSALVAYSGGVDSTFLLKVGKDMLGENLLAVTASSETYPLRELEEARKLARILRVRHLLINTDELSNPEFSKNTQLRCYWCKKELFSKLSSIARKDGLNYVLDGANYDDVRDYRPGMRAAEELGIRSPLKEAELGKEEIRAISKQLGLPTWNKPSFACLASRFPYGTQINEDNLATVDKAENFMRKLGFIQLRVRHHGKVARIEVSTDELPKLLNQGKRENILKYFKALGYSYITADLEGYRTGSMNETLKKAHK